MAINIARRKFVAAVSGTALAWPLTARAQQSPMPVIGFVSGESLDGSSISERRQHWRCVLKQRGMPLVRIAAEEAIEILEAQTSGPLIKGPSRTLHPLWNEVVLAEPRCVVAVVHENIADRACALGHDRGVAWISRGELRDVAHTDALMVATGEQRSTSRGT